MLLTVSTGTWDPLPRDMFVNKFEAISTDNSGVKMNWQFNFLAIDNSVFLL